MSNDGPTYAKVLKSIENDPNVLGVILQGSRGKGFENEHSDYDVRMVVKDEVVAEYKKRFDGPLRDADMPVDSFSEFKGYAAWGSPEASGERYDFTHCQVLIDRNGEIAKLAAEKGSIPKEAQYDFVYNSLDAYVNAAFRSVKAWRNKNRVGARLEGAFSIPYFLDALFGAYGRPKPYYAYLERELEKYPLEDLPWVAQQLVETLVSILETGDLKIQQELLKSSERFFRGKGFGKMFDSWEGKDKWAMEFEL